MSGPPPQSRTFRLKVWGDNACFTRPEMKVERVSYDVMTPSAARGIFDAILWKPVIFWCVTRIDVLNPICFESVRRNEVGAVISPKTRDFFVEEHRQQRAGFLLRNVAYTLWACFEMTPQAGPHDNIRKFEEIFIRRAQKGQCFHRPYLGCREFAAHFQLLPVDTHDPPSIDETRDLGFMLYDLDFSTTPPEPLWFRARLDQGKMHLPRKNSKEVQR